MNYKQLEKMYPNLATVVHVQFRNEEFAFTRENFTTENGATILGILDVQAGRLAPDEIQETANINSPRMGRIATRRGAELLDDWLTWIYTLTPAREGDDDEPMGGHRDVGSGGHIG